MSVKLHLVDAESPLTEGTDIIPLCQQGEKTPVAVRKAIFELKVAEEFCENIDDLLDTIRGLCQECRNLTLEERYIYAIRDGEDDRAKAVNPSASAVETQKV